MNKKILIWIVVIVVIVAFIILLTGKNSKGNGMVNNIKDDKSDVLSVTNNDSNVKEFTMTSFVEMVDGKPKPQYSLKEITVNKGDKVRIKITVTAGMHNFNIDEYGINIDTPLNKEVVAEFVADKAGEFVYYCSKPGHRQNGHWGTLKVLE